MQEKHVVESLGNERLGPERKVEDIKYTLRFGSSHISVTVRLECGHVYETEVKALHKFHKNYQCPQCFFNNPH